VNSCSTTVSNETITNQSPCQFTPHEENEMVEMNGNVTLADNRYTLKHMGEGGFTIAGELSYAST
jgi:hypothetical protein